MLKKIKKKYPSIIFTDYYELKNNVNTENFGNISVIKEVDITKEDIEQISKYLIPNCEDLVINSDLWESGLLGIIQIIVIKHIADILNLNN